MGAWLGRLCPGMGVALCGTPTHCNPGGPGVHSLPPPCLGEGPSCEHFWPLGPPPPNQG